MDKTGKFVLPSPKFTKLDKTSSPIPHFLSPQGMLLPKDKQPPPMYGPRGTTLPPRFLGPQGLPSTSKHYERVQKYFCEPCEAEFHTSTDYKVHRSEHTECDIDNCSFRGHPSFMAKHIVHQHGTGLYDQLKRLSTPEEIAKWREDRKKNYPTLAIVEQKWKAREQRILRGEKLEGNKSRFGKKEARTLKEPNKGKSDSTKRRKKRNRNPKQGTPSVDKNNEVPEQISVTIQTNEEPTCGGVRMFKGTGEMHNYKKIKKVDTHVLSSLVGMYGSDSNTDSDSDSNNSEETEENEGKVEEAQQSSGHLGEEVKEMIDPAASLSTVPKPCSNTDVIMEDSASQITSYECVTTHSDHTEGNEESLKLAERDTSDDDGPEETPIEKTSNIPDKPQSEIPRKKPKGDAPKKTATRSGLDYRKLRGGRQNTMLEKLLEPDIRHERNVLLQCVRFVMENNFFGVGSNSQS